MLASMKLWHLLAAVAAVAVTAIGGDRILRRVGRGKKLVDLSDLFDKHRGYAGVDETRKGGWIDADWSECPAQSDHDDFVRGASISEGGGNHIAANILHVGSSMVIPSDDDMKLDVLNLGGMPEEMMKFLNTRIAEIDQVSDEGNRACLLVDLYDELGGVQGDMDDIQTGKLQEFREKIILSLKAKGYELIRGDTWDPDFMKAVVVTKGNHSGVPQIVRILSSGLRHKDLVIRKQEVSVLA